MTDPSIRPTGADAAPVRGFRVMRDIPTAFWLALTVVATIVHRDLPEPRWLTIHLLLLGAVTHAILVWSEYFSFALLRRRPTASDRRRQNARLVLSNAGAALVLVGVPTQVWALTAVGAAALVAAVIWHAIAIWRRSRGALPGKFGRTVRYYLASAGLLAIGAVLGAVIAHGDAAPQLAFSHALINVLGWIGITVAGTVVTLWPTILRTRADERAAAGAARALPALAAGVLVAALGAALVWLPLLVLGLASYLAGLGVLGVSLWRAARQAPPRSFSAMSVGMALVWWAGAVIVLLIGAVVGSVGTLTGTTVVGDDGIGMLASLVDGIVPYLAAGFAAQVLIGALSYLIPVVLGGGPGPVRIGTAAFDRLGALRIAVANAALVVCALPVSSTTRVVASIMYLIAMTSFLVIMVIGMRAQRRAKRSAAQRDSLPEPVRVPAEDPLRGRRAGQAVAGLLAVVLAVAVSVTVDPLSSGPRATPTADPDAPVSTVQVQAADMRFTPNRIEVEAGTRLVIELTNTDESQMHDLVLANGTGSERLAPGQSETIDVGVITADLDGWCSIIGHRQMGMTLTIVVVGSAGDQAEGADSGIDGPGHDMSDMSPDLMTEPGVGFEPYDATLAPLAQADGPTTHRVTLTVRDTIVEVAPGVTQTLWTYNGTAPGPTLHGRVGDTFIVTLVNSATMGHSIDFHAGALAPDLPMRTIEPGERLTYEFTAMRAGIWMYHCSTMPMSAHIANGMYGAVVIESGDLPAVDRSYVVVQGEYYLGDHDGGLVDVDKIETRSPDLVVFNGYANQYDYAPLIARVGERVRVWVLDAGVERPSSFHVVGGQFDTVWQEGRYLIHGATDTGAQALGLLPAQGGFVELTFPEAGHYPFVSHLMIDAEHGAHGMFVVTDG